MSEPPQEIFRDIAIGLTDGLTVPFSVASGLVSASLSHHAVIAGVVAEIVAGSISMGFADYLGIETENRKDIAFNSALRIGFSYVLGGLIPLAAYMFISDLQSAFYVSIASTIVALALFGWFRAYYTKTDIKRSILKTITLGTTAAIITYVIAKAFMRKV